MKKLATCLIVIIISIALFSGSLASGFLNDPDAIEKAAKSVLKIYAFETSDDDYYSMGSGFVAFNNSTLITNYHVIEGAHIVIAEDDDDNIYELDKVLCADKEADIVILGFTESSKLQPLELYPDNNIKRGSPVIAIGSPRELKNIVSSGIVSYQYDDDGIPVIQITAPISPGSSGGALFNDDGKVIGVTSALYSSQDEYGTNTNAQNLNFAINIAVAQAMYNAWDGTTKTLYNYKSTAKMDFTNVYKHDASAQASVASKQAENQVKEDKSTASETWTCLNCGKENNTKFCLECGAEKPYWVCACGIRYTSNRFCGECGRSYMQLIESFNAAMTYSSQHNFNRAIDILNELGLFDSGSFETTEGKHSVAADFIKKVYYDQGIYLISINDAHADILKAFELAGDYADAKDQIEAENTRYAKRHYDLADEYFSNGDYSAAINAYTIAGKYQDAEEKINFTYYTWGTDLLKKKEYEKARNILEQIINYEDSGTLIKQSYYDEAMDLVAKEDYIQAMIILTGLGDYSDSEEQIKRIYYIRGKKSLENEDLSNAKVFFSRAGDYQDAADLYNQIRESEKNKIYNEAKQALDQGEYDQAIAKLTQISGYNDADKLLVEAKILKVQKQYELINFNDTTSQNRTLLRSYITELEKYPDNEKAISLYKEINYALGTMLENYVSYISETVDRFTKAGDYKDAADHLLTARVQEYERYIKSYKYATAQEYFTNYLVPAGYDQEYILVEVGYQGDFFVKLGNLARAIGIENIPQKEKTYKQTYVKSIQKLENHFGFQSDGQITLSEYIAINDMIFVGSEGTKVKNILEKLADLSYLQKLDDKHTKYEAKYTTRIKNAENKLGLKSDGVLTKDEYEKIMALKTDGPAAPKSLKIQVQDDTVTITWAKVEGAFFYEVMRGTTVLGTTDKTSWTDKNVPTGVTHIYSVKTKNYTVGGSAVRKKIEVKKYYKPLTIAELNKNYQNYKERYVKMNNLKIYTWAIQTPEGEYKHKDTSLIYNAMYKDNYNVIFLCQSGDSYVEIVLQNYKAWDWNNDKTDLLSKIDRVSSISITGYIRGTPSTWVKKYVTPVVKADHISFSNN